LTFIWKKAIGQKSQKNAQMLLIRTQKYELWLWLLPDDILQAAYKFKKES
jgi:hypothetical protein